MALRTPLATVLTAATAVFVSLPAPVAAQVSPEQFAPMAARSIGPAGMSGRVSAVDVVLSDRNIIFVASATGGVWKSDDGGLQWRPVFDSQDMLGTGAVAVFQKNPDIVWVGGGEGNPRNSAGVGGGIYRSLDGGETWKKLGLERSERIHRIVLHPENPDIAWVGALGPAWSEGGQRGVYKTTDGGETWSPILQVNDRTGVADMVMDPTNPDKLLVAMWEYRRWPWFFESGGEGSGLYLTRDGGDSWSRLSDAHGLPAGPLGRMGLAIAPSDPEVIYALVEAERSELLRSDDGGRSFQTISDRPGIAPRPFYYADLRVDPLNENRIYSLHSSIQVSEDAGRTFRTVVPSALIHGDVHELWIDPQDPRHMIIGEDGGIAFTYNRGETWRFVENLPLAQFYHIAVDNAVPFNVYGGLQDNGSWYGPSAVFEDRGIFNAHWRRVGGGDGFATLNDASDSRYGYTLSQQGRLSRFDKETGIRQMIQPVHPDGVPLRFNWNAALNIDPHDSTTIYLGSQFVHRSRDHGASWDLISPDLTTNDPEKQRQMQSGGLSMDASGAENHTTILSIAPSPLESGLIWVTTDDGNVQVSRDDGATWTNVVGSMPGAPETGWASHVEPSKHHPAVAYVTMEEHRRGDWTPYLFRTEDYGESWERMGTAGIRGYVHVLEEDPVEADLLFVGGEFGLFVSADGGASWMDWHHGMPPAPVRALVVHPRDGDLVLGTHGRAAWVLDDVRPLRSLARDPSWTSQALAMPELAPAQQATINERIGYRSTGHAMQHGENRPYGALIHYWVGQGLGDEASVSIRDGSGQVVRTLTGPAEIGLNRVVWDLSMDPPDGVGGRGGGTEVLPGAYSVTVTAGDHEARAPLTVLPDPRVSFTMAERREKLTAIEEAQGWAATADAAREALQAALDGVTEAASALDDEGEALRSETHEVLQLLSAANERLFTGPQCQGLCGGDPLAGRVSLPLRYLGSSPGGVTALDRLTMTQASSVLDQVLEEVNALLSGPVAALRQSYAAAGVNPVPRIEAVHRR